MRKLKNILATLGSTVLLATATPGQASQDSAFDVSYFWNKNLHAVAEYKGEVSTLLGPNLSRDLHIVREGDYFGVIYDRNGDLSSSQRVAVKHSKDLQADGLGAAVPIKDTGYHRVVNVSYGSGPNLDVLVEDFGTVYRRLGPEVGKDLVIERKSNGTFALVYKRTGDRASSLDVAASHERKLKKDNISTDISFEDGREIVYDESTHLHKAWEEKTARYEAELEKLTEEHSVFRPPPEKDLPAWVQDSDKAQDQLARLPPQHEEEFIGPRPRFKPTPPNREPESTTIYSELEAQIEAHITSLRGKGLISTDEKTAWSVYDFSTGEKIVTINEDVPLQTASMIKAAIPLAYYLKFEGRIGPKARKAIKYSIWKSDNYATNWLIKRIGGPQEVERILESDPETRGIFQDLTLVDYIPLTSRDRIRAKRRGVETRGVPSGRSYYTNTASAHDYSRFLHALWNETVPYASEIKHAMALPGKDRIYKGVPEIPVGTGVYNKTGTTARLVGDMGILHVKDSQGHRHAYTVIGIIEKEKRARDFSQWSAKRGDVIRDVSGMIYQAMQDRYRP